jgi:soluble cytochrome b562
MKNRSTLRLLLVTLTLASAAPTLTLRAEDAPMVETKDLIAELKAQKEKNSMDSEDLRRKMDALVAELEKSEKERESASRAVVITAAISGALLMSVLFVAFRRKSAAQREMEDMNKRLKKQWEDLAKANEELARMNKQLAESLAELNKEVD